MKLTRSTTVRYWNNYQWWSAKRDKICISWISWCTYTNTVIIY